MTPKHLTKRDKDFLNEMTRLHILFRIAVLITSTGIIFLVLFSFLVPLAGRNLDLLQESVDFFFFNVSFLTLLALWLHQFLLYRLNKRFLEIVDQLNK